MKAQSGRGGRRGADQARRAWLERLGRHTRVSARARNLATLTFTLWLNFGSTYYLLTVLAGPITADTAWPLTSLVAGLSLGLTIAGLSSPAVGRVIERHGGRPVLAFGSLVLAIGLAGLGLAPNLLVYYLAWALLGVGMSAGLYDAAFATLGRHYGPHARPLIGRLALTVGFSLATSWPFSAVLLHALGWRGVCFCYAGMHLALGLPMHLFLRPADAASDLAPTGLDMAAIGSTVADTAEAPHRRWILAVLVTNLTLSIAIGSVLQVHLLTLLQGLGVAFAGSVGLGSLIWVAQGGGRLVEVVLGRRFHPVWEGVGASAFVVAGLALMLAAQPVAIAFGLFLFGLGNGVRGIVKGTLPLVLFGAAGYATLIGRLGLPTLIAQAAGPALGALALARWGPMPTLLVLTGLALANLLLSYAMRIALPRAPTLQPRMPGGLAQASPAWVGDVMDRASPVTASPADQAPTKGV